MPGIVNRVQVGDPIRASDWNRVADNINEFGIGASRSRRRTFTGKNDTGSTIPARGVATLGSSQLSLTEPVIELEQAGTGLPVAVIVETPTGSGSAVHIIDKWSPTQVLCSDMSVVAGDTVGPEPGTFQVGKAGNGLLAVTAYQTGGTVWVVSARGSSGGNNVAKTTNVIDARSNLTPGGPFTVTRQKLQGGQLVDDGDVEIYSWVNSPSKDPAIMTNPNGVLYIFIEQDDDGIWWWTGEDCDPIQTAIDTGTLLTNTDVPQGTPVLLTDTTITIASVGIYQYTLNAEVDVSGVPGNQTWDVDIGLYNVTDGVWVGSFSWAGAGNPPTNPFTNFTQNFDMLAGDVGDTFQIAAVRNTATGTVTLQANTTLHQLTGPLR